VSLQLVTDKIKEAGQSPTSETLRKLFLSHPTARFYTQELPKRIRLAKEKKDVVHEEAAIFLLQRLYMEEDAQGSPKYKKELWNVLSREIKPSKEITSKVINVLKLMSLTENGVGGASGSRLRIFHAMMLLIREDDIPDAEFPKSELSDDFIEKLYKTPGKEGRHPEGIPDYCIDR